MGDGTWAGIVAMMGGVMDVYRNDDGVEAVSMWNVSLVWLQGAAAQWGADGSGWGIEGGLPRMLNKRLGVTPYLGMCVDGGRLPGERRNGNYARVAALFSFVWQCAGQRL